MLCRCLPVLSPIAHRQSPNNAVLLPSQINTSIQMPIEERYCSIKNSPLRDFFTKNSCFYLIPTKKIIKKCYFLYKKHTIDTKCIRKIPHAGIIIIISIGCQILLICAKLAEFSRFLGGGLSNRHENSLYNICLPSLSSFAIYASCVALSFSLAFCFAMLMPFGRCMCLHRVQFLVIIPILIHLLYL